MFNLLKTLLNDNFTLIFNNMSDLELINHYYVYKNNNKNTNDNDLINMLDILIEDIKEYYYKDRFVTFIITFYEYNPKLNLYKVISKPFKFDYVHDHCYSGESIFNCIEFNEINVSNSIIIKINITPVFGLQLKKNRKVGNSPNSKGSRYFDS
jgi:hypothetical protein